MVKEIVTAHTHKEELGMMCAIQEEVRRCSSCGAEINNDSLVCSQCDEDDVYFPIDMGE